MKPKDPWKYVAFPVAAVAGYLLALGLASQFAAYTGLSEFNAEIAVVAIAGFISGFMVDDVIPAYIEKVTSGGAGGGMGGSNDDFDFE